MRRTIRDLDLWISLAVLCAMSTMAALAYASIRTYESGTGTLLSNLKTGTHSARILIGQSCPGELTTTITHDSMWLLLSTGTFRSSYGKARVDLSLKAEAFFNPLGQLNQARFEVSSPDARLSVQLSNPNPISVQVQKRIHGEATAHTFTVPGPIMIAANRSSDTFSISYPASPTLQEPSLTALRSALFQELAISLVDNQNTPAHCDTPGAQRLDLLPLTIRFQSFVQPFMGLIPTASEMKP